VVQVSFFQAKQKQTLVTMYKKSKLV